MNLRELIILQEVRDPRYKGGAVLDYDSYRMATVPVVMMSVAGSWNLAIDNRIALMG